MATIDSHAGETADDKRIASTLLEHARRAERDAHEALADSERFRQSFEYAPIGIAIVALDGMWLRVNRALCELTGYPEAELVGMTFQQITHPHDLQADLRHVEQLLAGERQSYQMDKRYLHADGHIVWVQLNASLVRDQAGRALHFIAQVLDVSARKAYEQELQETARRDGLTELLNRRGFEEELERHLHHTRRHGRPAALLMIDLDDFKAVNDAHGHRAGDDVLRGVAAAMRERLRAADVVARLGGDEFAVLLPEATSEQAQHTARELAELIAQHAIAAVGGPIQVAASIGVAMFDVAASADALLGAADREMYAVKRARRTSAQP